jgi:hypothetical protein
MRSELVARWQGQSEDERLPFSIVPNWEVGRKRVLYGYLNSKR